MEHLTFHDVTLQDVRPIHAAVEKADLFASQYSHYNLFCLRKKYGTQICFQADTLYIRQPSRDTNTHLAYLFPVSHDSVVVSLKNIYLHARSENRHPLFWGVTSDMLRIVEDVFPCQFDAEEVRDWADYLYEADSLYANMKQARIFERKNEGHYACELITPANIQEIICFQHWWFEENKESNDDMPSLIFEHNAIIEALGLFEQLALHGLCIRIDGKISGYCLTVAQTEDYAISHILKVNKQYRGLAEYMGRSGLMDVGKPYVNLEEDIGIKGIREFKLHLKPSRILNKYIVRFKGEETN